MKSGYHHGNLRHALLQQALVHIEEVGISALTLRAVARRVGVTHAAPYRHFADKRALLAAVAQRGFEQLLTSIHNAIRPADEAISRLNQTASAYVHFAVDNPALFRLMFGPELSDKTPYPDLAAAADNAFAVIPTIIVEAQAAGVVRQGDPQQLAMTMWSIGHGTAALLLDDQLPPGVEPDVNAVIAQATHTLYFGLKPR